MFCRHVKMTLRYLCAGFILTSRLNVLLTSSGELDLKVSTIKSIISVTAKEKKKKRKNKKRIRLVDCRPAAFSFQSVRSLPSETSKGRLTKKIRHIVHLEAFRITPCVVVSVFAEGDGHDSVQALAVLERLQMFALGVHGLHDGAQGADRDGRFLDGLIHKVGERSVADGIEKVVLGVVEGEVRGESNGEKVFAPDDLFRNCQEASNGRTCIIQLDQLVCQIRADGEASALQAFELESALGSRQSKLHRRRRRRRISNSFAGQDEGEEGGGREQQEWEVDRGKKGQRQHSEPRSLRNQEAERVYFGRTWTVPSPS